MTSGAGSSHSQKRRILKNTAANGVAQAAAMVSAFVFLPMLVHAFTVPIYGVMALAASVSGYALLLDLGVGATLTRMVAERTAKDDDAGAAQAIFSAAGIYGLLGVFVALVMAVLAVAAGSVFNVSADEAALLRTLLLIGAAQQLWYWPTAAARDSLAGLQRYDLISAVTLGSVTIDILGTIYVLVSGHGPVMLLLIRTGAMVLASLAHMTMLGRVLPGILRRIRASLADAKAILRSGSAVFVLQIAQVMSRQQTDKLVLGVFLGPSAVALYEIGAKLHSLMAVFTGWTVSAMLPVAAELNAREQHTSLRSLFLRGTKIIAVLAAPLTTVLIAISAPLIGAWVGVGFEAAVPVAQLLLFSQILLPLYQLGDQILIGKDRFSVWVPGGVTLALLNVVLSVVLVQRLGLIGVAVGTLVAVLAEFPWYMAVFGREMKLGPREWLVATAWPSYPLLAVPATIAWFGSRTTLGTSLAGLVLVSAVAVAAYWGAMWFLGFSAGERSGALAVLQRRSAGAGA